MTQPLAMVPREILHPGVGATKFQLTRYAPAPDLSRFVLRYWLVTWDLGDQAPYHQESLLPPCVNLVFEAGKSAVFGVVSGKSTQLLQGAGWVFGVKFKPGAFYLFFQHPIAQLTDSALSITEAFGAAGCELEALVLAQPDAAAMIAPVEAFLRARLPPWDPNLDLINQIVDQIIVDRTITQVDAVAARFNLSKRSLQRIFKRYVGVSPKWVIKRYRLHGVAEQMARGALVDWPQLALDLGYFDQPHLIKDFKAVVGRTPADYLRSLGGAGS
ncbi:MAG: helix-turn-helix domain-containing protein [Chloroflexales bacterium]|nr:helix-turn-helix domain-containing protein [Chloroflexales bacterium]